MNETESDAAASTASAPAALNRLLKQALSFHQARNYPQAEAAYKQVLNIQPDHSAVLCMLGILKKEQKQPDRAAVYLRQSIEINPDYADAHCHLGAVLANQNNLDDALTCFQKALEINPQYLDALQNTGAIYRLKGQLEKALHYLSAAAKLSPGPAPLFLAMSMIFQDLQQDDKALEMVNQAIAADPSFAEAYVRRGTLHQEREETGPAINDLTKALSINDKLADAHINIGLCLTMEGVYDKAEASYRKALQIAPNNAPAHSNLGVLLRILSRTEDAVTHFETAIELAPDYAEARQNLSFALLTLGQYEKGLDAFEWRWKVPAVAPRYRNYNKPLWDGKTDISGKTLFLWPEQGPNDVCVWAAVLPQLINKAGHCIVSIYPKLEPLFRRSFPEAEIRADDGPFDPAQNDFDYHLPMGSLFRCLRPDLESDTAPLPHLVADPDQIDHWRSRLLELGPGPYIGISWKGALLNKMRAPNYTDVEDWADLISTPGTFVSLQCGEASEEVSLFEARHGVHVHEFQDLDLFDDLDGVAALTSALDGVASVSTCVSGISAAVGTPTWIIAWRQSPWHNFLLKSRGPQIKFFERDTGETWHDVLMAVRQEIRTLSQDIN